jgi:hypothetical protein
VGYQDSTSDFGQIDSVLARFSGITTSPEDFQTKDGQYLCSEWHALMRGYLQSLSCLVINRPRPELWYKTDLQIADIPSLISNLKFRLPRTMVTTDFNDARAFFELCGRRIRYSPLTFRSRYIIETEEDLRKLEPLSKVLPMYLSEVVPGDAVDAFVVGNDVVFDGPEHPAASQHCREIAAALELSFCQFNLISARDGYYFTGLQCMPHLFDCADETRSIVVGHLADLLCRSNGRRSQ